MINLPDFKEFIKKITPEMCKEIENNSSINIEELKEQIDSIGFAAITSVMANHNFQILINFLALYHKWLSEELRKG